MQMWLCQRRMLGAGWDESRWFAEATPEERSWEKNIWSKQVQSLNLQRHHLNLSVLVFKHKEGKESCSVITEAESITHWQEGSYYTRKQAYSRHGTCIKTDFSPHISFLQHTPYSSFPSSFPCTPMQLLVCKECCCKPVFRMLICSADVGQDLIL